MLCKEYYMKFIDIVSNIKSFSLLVARLIIAYGFFEPAMNKWADIGSVARWFESVSIPFPILNAYIVATTEIIGVVLLTLGLLIRLISIPLVVVMVVAIITVHLGNGFSAGDNGFEIPLYYMIFLLIFIGNGAGKISLDRFIFDEKN